MELRQANPRRQGDIGELAAMSWLASQGYVLYVPLGHSPDVDLVAQEPGGRLIRVQVKTGTCRHKERWHVGLSTRGGNQSWNRVVKLFAANRFDYLFVLVADGRRWFIPSGAIDGEHAINLGGPKYARYEVGGREAQRRLEGI